MLLEPNANRAITAACFQEVFKKDIRKSAKKSHFVTFTTTTVPRPKNTKKRPSSLSMCGQPLVSRKRSEPSQNDGGRVTQQVVGLKVQFLLIYIHICGVPIVENAFEPLLSNFVEKFSSKIQNQTLNQIQSKDPSPFISK